MRLRSCARTSLSLEPTQARTLLALAGHTVRLRPPRRRLYTILILLVSFDMCDPNANSGQRMRSGWLLQTSSRLCPLICQLHQRAARARPRTMGRVIRMPALRPAIVSNSWGLLKLSTTRERQRQRTVITSNKTSCQQSGPHEGQDLWRNTRLTLQNIKLARRRDTAHERIKPECKQCARGLKQCRPSNHLVNLA